MGQAKDESANMEKGYILTKWFRIGYRDGSLQVEDRNGGAWLLIPDDELEPLIEALQAMREMTR